MVGRAVRTCESPRDSLSAGDSTLGGTASDPLETTEPAAAGASRASQSPRLGRRAGHQVLRAAVDFPI